MATYRVGEAGATVFDVDGREVMRLSPGQVVVAGLADVPGSLAQQHQHAARTQTRRIVGYADKRISAYDGKGVD